MALDSALSLIRGMRGESPKRIIERIVQSVKLDLSRWPGEDSASRNPLRSVWADRNGANLKLYVPDMRRDCLEGVVRELTFGRRNPYEVLEDRGILVVSSSHPAYGGAALSGGSYSSVRLSTHDGHTVVAKTVQKNSGADSIDGLQRHQNEAEWLVSASQLCSLFPRVERVMDLPDRFSFETIFFPAYSLAERAFQSRIKGTEIADTLIATYEQLACTLYSEEPIHTTWLDPDPDYLEKIRRRSRMILRTGDGMFNSLAAVIRASAVWVNGRACPSLAGLLRVVDSDPFWKPVIRPKRRHACHGDLILEDILLRSGPGGGIRLIDPNPYNQHGVIDLAKTMLSLWIGYEFIYFDFFQIETEVRNRVDGVAVEISVGRADLQQEYAAAAAQFMNFAIRELPTVLGLPARSFDRLIRMATALTSLAIPAFHSLGHRREDRALAFLALGLMHAERALSGDQQRSIGS